VRFDGVLHVCESTVHDDYWPVQGIQCHEYEDWLRLAAGSDFNVVFLPLSPAMRAVFDEQKAVDYVKAHLGLDYGIKTIIWGWIDMANGGNYPWPLTDDIHMLLPAMVGHVVPEFASIIWMEAISQRLNVYAQGLDLPDLYSVMHKKGLTFSDIISMPEQDSWKYWQVNSQNQTVLGPQLICNVFVCGVWRASGMFGSTSFQCTESSDWDLYTMGVFDANWQRPQVCIDADPELPVCQILGKYRQHLAYYNTRPLPVTDSFNSCPRGPFPWYPKPVNC